MTVDDLIKHFGTQKAACDALGFDRAAFTFWKKRPEGIPWATQCQFQVVTKGKLKADKRTGQEAQL